MESLQNRRILITGATSGIGKEIALSLIKYDVQLMLVGRNEKALQDLAGQPD
ncbi:MAG: SDR family NAD(P)-dependent oxidoreductase [Bacteroidales bacterium]|nr:SDR family NAD(P)-dependent oxidoreductase [Bacteroidales bacterium]